MLAGDVDGRRFVAVVIAAVAAAVAVVDVVVAAGGEVGGDGDDVEGDVGAGCDGRSSSRVSDVGDDDGVYRLQPAPQPQSTYSLCPRFPS